MSDKPVSPAFLAKAGERELEIFLLRDAARRELLRMHQQNMKDVVARETKQQRRRAEDIREAKIAIAAERPKPELVPKGYPPRKPMKEQELQAVAEHRVDSRNAAEINAKLNQQREREDAFLARQKEERLLREATEARERQTVQEPPVREPPAREPPPLNRDFDRAR